MRDYIFRAKRLDNGEWVQGGNILTLQTENPLIVDVYIYASGEAISTTEYASGINLQKVAGRLYKVDPATVGQYTRMTDKNGTKIFEHDIVKRKWNGSMSVYQIVFDNDLGAFIGEKSNGNFTTFDYDADFFEVIGNMHDSPVLLAGVE